MAETAINSFMMRFIQETEADASWRGVVRHVQTDEEARFTRIEEALQFIGRFVDVGGDIVTAGREKQLVSVRPHDQLGSDGEE